jgi:hypothetical protein
MLSIFPHGCHKWAVWFWNLFDAHALQSITPQLWHLFCCQGLPDAGCALLSGRHMDMTLVRCWGWPTTPAGPGFCRLNIFAYRLCLSMPGKRWPLEALNSIVSACPRDLHHTSCTNAVRVHSTVTCGGCQVPQEIGYPLSTKPTSWPENMGERPCVFTAQPLGQEAAVHVFKILNWTPGWGSIKQFQHSLRTQAAVLSTQTPFFGLSWAACGTLNHFPMISNLDEFRYI